MPRRRLGHEPRPRWPTRVESTWPWAETRELALYSSGGCRLSGRRASPCAPETKKGGAVRTAACTCLAMIVSAVSAAPGGQPKLVGEAVLMEVHSEFYGVPWFPRLSPDGERLLTTRLVPAKQAAAPQPGAENVRPKYLSQLVLRHWQTGKEQAVPVPPFADFDITAGTTTMSANPFSADGRLLVVSAGIDEDGDGIVARKEKVEPAVYDIESGKLRRIGVQGVGIFATFDAAGEHLIFTVVEDRPPAGRTYVAPVETLRPKALASWGLPLAPRPADTTAALGEIVVPPDGGLPRPKLVLYDYLKDAKAVDLPIHERNASLGPFVPQWTADGRYLYCTDMRGTGGLTQVWDVQEGKEVARLSDCLAIGPCGGPTTMVLSKPLRGQVGLLHDARTGSQEPLSDSTAIHPISTTGKYLLYDRKNDRGDHVLCRAEIQAGQSDFPSGETRQGNESPSRQ